MVRAMEADETASAVDSFREANLRTSSFENVGVRTITPPDRLDLWRQSTTKVGGQINLQVPMI